MLEPHYQADSITLYLGEALDVLPTLPDASVGAIVCDPPYALTELPTSLVTDALTAWLTGDRAYVPATGRGFMGRDWDRFVPPPAIWDECLRVLKPGGHLAAFAGARTVDLMGLSIRLAGFEIRDSIDWIFGSGMPKSLDVSKAIDKAAVAAPLWNDVRAHLRYWRDQRGMTNAQLNKAVGGATNGGGRASAWLSEDQRKPELPSKAQWARLREVLRWDPTPLDDVYDQVKDGAERPIIEQRATVRNGGSWSDHESAGMFRKGEVTFAVTSAATEDAARWQGWGTALKPAHEPIILARKPLAGTVAANVLAHGTGGLNIDGCRTAAGQDYRDKCASVVGLDSNRNGDTYGEWTGARTDSAHDAGRWPTNILLSHPPLVDEHGQPVGDACADGCIPGCPVAELDAQSGARPSGGAPGGVSSNKGMRGNTFERVRTERPPDSGGASRYFPAFRYEAKAPASERPRLADGTAWPTVKPLALMRWLVRLITPPGGTVLDWCAGTGTTLEAARLEDFPVIGVERDQTAAELCLVRLDKPYSVALFGDIA